MSEPKYAHRFPPCPVYDLEGLESWLEDLAKQGLILTKGGLFFGFAEFEKTTSKPMRYRLQPLPKKKFLEDRRPDDDALEFAKEYGWEYLCNLGDYAVYGCEDPNARELDTDPQVQAVALQQVYQKKKAELISSAITLLICIGLLFWLGPVSYALNANGWNLGFICLIWFSYPIFSVLELKQLRELHQKLLLGTPLSRTKNWRRKRWPHWISAVFYIAVYISFGILIFINNFSSWEDSRWQFIEEYHGEIPFATMEDLAGSGVLEPDGMFVEEDHHIAERSTLLAPRQIKLQQLGAVVQDGTTQMDGILEIEYYELRTDWLAEQLYREIRQNDARSKRHHLLPLNELPTEQEIAYTDVFPTLLLRDGNQVLRVELTQFEHGTQLTLDQWAAIMARSILG